MSVIAYVSVAPEDFKFKQTLRQHQEVRITIDRIVPAAKQYIPFIWIRGLSPESIRSTLEREHDVKKIEILDNENHAILVEITWTDQNTQLIERVAAEGGTIVNAVARDRNWNITLRFPSRMDLQTFYHHCADLGIYPTITQIHNRATPENDYAKDKLSDEQFETLQIAFEAGFFAVPREITIEELAVELNVSDAAVSQRLRRGIRNVLTEILENEARTN